MGGGPEAPSTASTSGSIMSSATKDHLVILLPIPEPKSTIAHLQKKFPHLKITFHGQTSIQDRTADASIFATCTILVTLFTLPKDPAKDAPHLTWVHFFSAGVNSSADHPIWKDKHITLTTSSGVHGPQISEWFTMTLLAQNHGYNILLDQQRQHNWDTSHVDAVHDLVGQRLGVLGYGSIGRQAARVAKAMGMDVLAYTATPKETKHSRKDRGFIVPGTGDPDGECPSAWYSGLDKKSLHHFLSQDLDVLLIAVPLTTETRHFLSAPEFDLLATKRTFISNISRGAILDQPALIAALKAKTIRGAALDVTDPEPLPADSELWDLENVTVTPHISGRGSAYADRSFLILEGNIEKRMRGEKMWNVVDRKRGY